MKLTKTLLTCPTNFRLRSINNYYTKCHLYLKIFYLI